MNIIEFARKASNLNLDKKMEASKNLQRAAKNDKLSVNEIKQLKDLDAWLTMNILVGNELCPPEQLLEKYKVN